MKRVLAAVLNGWIVWVPTLGATAAAMQTFWHLGLFPRVALVLLGATISSIAASHVLAGWRRTGAGFPNAQQKAALRRKRWLSRGAIVLLTLALVLLVRVVFDLGAIQVWQLRDAAGDKVIVYASLTSTERLRVSLPLGACVIGDLAGRARADWIAEGLGTDNPAILVRNFAFPESVAAVCSEGSMTSAAIADATPPPPIKPLSGAEVSQWHFVFWIWGALLCVFGLVWFQFRLRASA